MTPWEPVPVTVRVVAPAATALDRAALAAALAGPGGLAGVRAAVADDDGVRVELDAALTPLATLVALVDVELRGRARRIEPLAPLPDAVLVQLAGAALGAAIGPERVLEPHLDAARAAAARRAASP